MARIATIMSHGIHLGRARGQTITIGLRVAPPGEVARAMADRSGQNGTRVRWGCLAPEVQLELAAGVGNAAPERPLLAVQEACDYRQPATKP